MGRDVGSFLTGIIIIAILFVLVRPNSQGPTLVKNVSGALDRPDLGGDRRRRVHSIGQVDAGPDLGPRADDLP